MPPLDPTPAAEPSVFKGTELAGTPFIKMTGSGNDFVIFDGRVVPRALVTSPDAIAAICNRHNGIGADGVVYLEPRPIGADARVHYFNSDGSPADLCGNATLCSTAIAVESGLGNSEGMRLQTDAGLIASRLRDGMPEIELNAVSDVVAAIGIERQPNERQIGFAVVGVPHLVVRCDNVDSVPLLERGAELRWHEAVRPNGANVNFVSADPDGRWRYRTFERGVEGETLACGTGAVASAILLASWGLAGESIELHTSSGRILTIELARKEVDPARWIPTLRGEGRTVFRGSIGHLDGSTR